LKQPTHPRHGRDIQPNRRKRNSDHRALRNIPDAQHLSHFGYFLAKRRKYFRMHAQGEQAVRFSPSDDVVGFSASRRIHPPRPAKNNIAADGC
jgi:hypothetical protein